jgi:hypothetical protein
MNWKEIPLPALETLLSTGEAQPLAHQMWPAWARTAPRFSGAWFSYVGGSPVISTGNLSTGNIHAYVDIERGASEPPTFRYYRYVYVKMMDGRVFQAGPFKDLEYERCREHRPSWLASQVSTSTSTG